MATVLYRRKGDQFFDANGRMLVGGKLYYYVANTTTLQDTYADQNGVTSNTNPIVLNASGRIESPVYLGSNYDYKEILTDANGVTQSPWPFDNIPGAAGTSSPLTGFERLYLPWSEVTVSDTPVSLLVANAGAAYSADASGGGIDFELPAASAIQNGTGYYFKRTDSSAYTVTVTPAGSESIDGANSALVIPAGYSGVYLVSDGAQWLSLASTVTNTAINFTKDNGGIAISTGVQGDIRIPFNCTITSVNLLADQTGSIVVDIWKDTYANFPPTVADTITASAKPTISSGVKYNNGTLTGWTTTLAAGDILRVNVNSVSTITRFTLVLNVLRF